MKAKGWKRRLEGMRGATMSATDAILSDSTAHQLDVVYRFAIFV
jgi:hypothetical protein